MWRVTISEHTVFGEVFQFSKYFEEFFDRGCRAKRRIQGLGGHVGSAHPLEGYAAS